MEENLNKKGADQQISDNRTKNIAPQEEQISPEEIQQIISDIKNTYREALDQIFDNNDPLKQKVMDYFVNRAEVDNEYKYILSNLNNSDKRQYVNNLKNSLKDSSLFINKMERYFTTQDIYKSEKELKEKNRIATDEEYEIGAYSDFIEPQIREAIFTLNKKGYRTFQSGYSEKNPKNQFIDVYNSKVEIPEEFKKALNSYGVDIKIENFDDRTTVTLQPIDTNKTIRQEEWQKIWKYFSEQIPNAGTELVANIKEPTLHSDFRKMQDIIKKLN